MNVFHKYDIRGTIEITKEFATILAGKLANYFSEKTIVLGRDSRKSSPMLFKNLSETLRNKGKNIIYIGECTTPMLNYASIYFKKPAVMITASHNPQEYNGFKIYNSNAVPVWNNDLKNISYLSEKENTKTKGTLKSQSITELYIKKILSFANTKSKLKIAVDTGNGGIIVPVRKFFNKTKHTVYYINSKIDPTFPNHPPDPTNEENYEQLIAEMIVRKADLGIMFDGDGDRVWFVDEKARIIPPDLIFALMCDNEPKKLVVYDLRFSKVIDEIVGKKGIKMPVGNPGMKEILRAKKGSLGGELSGHFMFKDLDFIDDGLFGAIRVVNYIIKHKLPISKLVRRYAKYARSKELNFKVSDKDKVLEKIRKTYKNKLKNKLDGLVIGSKDWWFNVRKSNTEDLLRVIIEAKNKQMLAKIKKELTKLCK